MDYTARFSGHETFPLRYGWLFKAVREVQQGRRIRSTNKDDVESAVINMGVGKNMVNSIKYWADISHIIVSDKGNDRLTEEARLIFGQVDTDRLHGFDPYMENPTTVWLLHWLINSNHTELTATRWFFNFFNGQRFDKKQLFKALIADISRLGVSSSSPKTIEKDIDCLIQTYTLRLSSKKRITEDSFSSPLTELGLLHSGEGKTVRAELSNPSSLSNELFLYCLVCYWKRYHATATTLSFDGVLSSPGSPARIFRLSQSALGDRIDEAQRLTQGAISWTDTQGLRGILCNNINAFDELSLLKNVYEGTSV